MNGDGANAASSTGSKACFVLIPRQAEQEGSAGAYEKGEVRPLPVVKEVYEAGRSC